MYRPETGKSKEFGGGLDMARFPDKPDFGMEGLAPSSPKQRPRQSGALHSLKSYLTCRLIPVYCTPKIIGG
jgi:hypothetical protein